MIASAAASANITPSANAYWIASIAVLGTALGAAISAITQMLTSRRSSASQLAILKLQMDHQTSEAIRQERQQAYARFLLAVDKWGVLCFLTYEAVLSKADLPGNDEAYVEYATAHTELDLLASRKLAALANKKFNQDVIVMNKIREGADYYKSYPKGTITPGVLITAMQEELQLTGGFPINPEAGLGAWGDDSYTVSLRHPDMGISSMCMVNDAHLC